MMPLVPKEKLNDLISSLEGEILMMEPMSVHTTYDIGGPAFMYALPVNSDDLVLLLEFAKSNNLPKFAIGGGSNLLVHDKGYPGMIFDLKKGFKNLRFEGTAVFAESAVSLAKFVAECRKHNLAGVEKLAGIPGTLGGALFMNAGAFGSEISRNLTVLTILLEDGTIKELKAVELVFDYRQSHLPEGSIIISGLFELHEAESADELKRTSKETVDKRKDRQPVEFPNPGSIFKNPEEGPPAGKLIEDAGLKGKRTGGAVISKKHANFIVNKGSATAEDVVHLIALAKDEVSKQFGIELELEIRLIGWDEWFI